MHKYTYTVALTHYNNPLMLKRMLASIPERDDIQVVVADDYSTEENKEILRTLSHKNLQIIYIPENHGGGYARNVALDHTEGKWIIGADCDDFFSSGAFDVLDKYKDSDYDYITYKAVAVDAKSLKPSGYVLGSVSSINAYLKDPIKNRTRFRFVTDTWVKMTSMRFMKEYGIRWEDCRINIDRMYSYQLGIYAKKIKVIPDVLYNWVENEGSITRKKRDIEREFQFYLAMQKRNGFFEALGLKRPPYYRYDILYVPFLLKKRGLKDTIDFFRYRHKHISEVYDARRKFLPLLENVDIKSLNL